MNDKTSSTESAWSTDATIKKRNDLENTNTTLKAVDVLGETLVFGINEEKETQKNNGTEPVDVLEKFKGTQPPIIDVSNYTEIDWIAIEKEIFSSLNWDDLQIGEPVEAEHIIAEIIKETTSIEMMNWLNQLYLEHSSNVLLLCTLLHALSHLDYEMIYPAGPMLVVASLSHKDKRVVSFAIKTFSNWNSKESIKYAKSFSPQQAWAKREWDSVINYIQENGDEINGIFDETNQARAVDTKSA